jgi:hypothetical protein
LTLKLAGFGEPYSSGYMGSWSAETTTCWEKSAQQRFRTTTLCGPGARLMAKMLLFPSSRPSTVTSEG